MPSALAPQDLCDRLSAGCILVDARDPRAFGVGHIAGSLNVWIDGPQFAERVSWFVPPDASLILLVDNDADVDRAIAFLARVGLRRRRRTRGRHRRRCARPGCPSAP